MLFRKLKRVSAQYLPELDNDEKAVAWFRQLAEQDRSVLIVANTRSHAAQLFHMLRNPRFALFHLSTNMCPAHRRDTITSIRCALKTETRPVIVVSTSLIEAGVDISFRAAVRYLCGLDSIVQTAGRCNRNAETAQGSLYILPNPRGVTPPPFVRRGAEATRTVLLKFSDNPGKYENDLLHPLLLDEFYRKLYEYQSADMKYPVEVNGISDSLLNLLSENSESQKAFMQSGTCIPAHSLFAGAYHTAGSCFHAIDDFAAAGVIAPYPRGGRGEALVAAMRTAANAEKWNSLLREAQRFSVNVSDRVLERLREAEAVVELPNGVLALKPDAYDAEIGLLL